MPPRTKPGPQRRYDDQVRAALITLWEAADRICGKRLKVLIATLTDAMARHAHLTLSKQVRQRLSQISAATIDRLLHDVREQAFAGQRRRAGGVDNAIRRAVPIGIVLRQLSHEGKRIFVGANRSGSRTRQRDVTLGELAAAPAQLQMCPILFSMNGNTDFLERKRYVFLAITHISKRITVSIRQVAHCRSVYRCHRQCAKARLFHARY
ncbi:hypothetical protein [Burkholderia sp. b14]|uniref:hypothetical protein n=1 Tax=Burkholderia sp. b14 TaxID=1761775 RepID=UPI002570C629|nr:hypothetical protein [Burkholderia sp. b14]